MIYDALIVGAGPAGSLLAYLLAKAKYRVAIIDKESFPRNKVCGGGISNKTVDLLKKYFDISPILQKKIQGAYLTFQNKHTFIKDLGDRGGGTVLRSEFDNFILNKATNEGATFFPKCAFDGYFLENDIIKVQTSCQEFESKFLIGADGVFSRVRNSVFGRDLVSYAPSIEALIYLPESEIKKYENRTLFDFGGMDRGYGWIFPKRDHLNVGVFSVFGSNDNIHNDLQRFISYYKTLHNYSDIKYLGFSIPLRNELNLYEKGNIWLIGDAAGFAESMYGEGIYYALLGSEIASRAFKDSFDSREKGIYTNYLSEGMLEEIKYSERIANIFYRMQRFGYYSMVRNKYVNNYFSELIAGNVSYKECYWKTMLTAPYWLFSQKYSYEDIHF